MTRHRGTLRGGLTGTARLLAASVVALVVIGTPMRAQNLVERWSMVPDSAAAFVAPRSIVVTADCAVWFSDPQTGVWRAPCSGGTPSMIGAIGEDPGQYRQPWLLTLVPGDSGVAAWDRELYRLSLFTSGGAFVRSRGLLVPEARVGRVLAMSRPANDGSVRLWTVQMPTVADRVAQRAYVLSARTDGSVRDSLLVMRAPTSIAYDAPFGFGAFDAPLARRPFVAFAPDGGFVAGNSDNDRLDVYDAAGKLRGSLQLPLPAALPVTRADRDAYADSVKRAVDREMTSQNVEDSLRVQFRPQLDTLLRTVAFPTTMQRYDQLILDDRAATVWLLLPARGVSYARTWFVCALAEPVACRTVSVQHQGAVVAATLRDGALYTIEQTLDGARRIAKYGPPE